MDYPASIVSRQREVVIPKGRWNLYFSGLWNKLSTSLSNVSQGAVSLFKPFNTPQDAAKDFSIASESLDRSFDKIFEIMNANIRLYTGPPEIAIVNYKRFCLDYFDDIEGMFALYYKLMGREYKSKKAISDIDNIPKSYIVFLIELLCDNSPSFDTNDRMSEQELMDTYMNMCQGDLLQRTSGAIFRGLPSVTNPLRLQSQLGLVPAGYDDQGKQLYAKQTPDGRTVYVTIDDLIQNRPWPGRGGRLYKKKRRSTKKRGKKGTKKGGKRKRKTSRK